MWWLTMVAWTALAETRSHGMDLELRVDGQFVVALDGAVGVGESVRAVGRPIGGGPRYRVSALLLQEVAPQGSELVLVELRIWRGSVVVTDAQLVVKVGEETVFTSGIPDDPASFKRVVMTVGTPLEGANASRE